MKKLFTLLTLLVAIVTGAQAQESVTKTYTFDDNVALATDWDVTTDVPSGGTANCVITNSLNNFSLKDGNFLGLSYLNKSNIGITVTTTASYDNISEISIDAIANDNSKPTFAAYIVTETGDVEVFAAVGSKDGFATGGTNKWGNKTVTLASPVSGKLKIVTVASSSGKYAALDNIKITYSEGTSDTRTNLVGAWSAATSTFDFGSTATAPTFSVTPNTATPGTAYSVAYSLVSGSNVTVDATNGITAIDTNTPGESVVKATITVIDGENYKATTTEYETTITVNPEPGTEPVTIFSADVTVTSNQSFAAGTVEVTSTQATISGGKVYAINGQSSAKNLIAPQSNIGYFCMTNNNTYFKVELNQALAEGDIITAKGIGGEKDGVAKGIWVTSTDGRPNSAPACAGQSTSTSVVDPILSYTVTANDEYVGKTVLYISRAAGASTYFDEFKITRPAVATETYTVTFNAGSNGTCATASLTEATPGAGVELPAVTANEDYQFNGWFTAATEGTKVGDAGETYHPTANVEIFAQYSQLAAPTISVTPTAPSTYKGVATTLTANVTGVPAPTVTWYKNTASATTGGTEVGTGLTYQPDVTTEGIFYYYAVAANGVEPSATSELVTLTVTDPDKYITGNAYYMSVDEVAVAGENVYAADITMTIKDYEGGAANADNYVSGINSNYVAQISGTHNGWGTEFVATKNGTLSVGVIINGGKTFTLTNVTSFDYNGVQDDGNNNTSESAGTNASSTWTPSKKQWTVLTFDVVAGTTYKLSVAGSKMGFYGFTFTPTVPVTITSAGAASFSSTEALDFSAVEGITAYKATAKSDSYVHLDEVAQVPAGAGVIIKTSEELTEDKTYQVPVATGDVAELEGNLLVGTAEATYTVGEDYGKVFKYAKRTSDGVVGFQKAKADWTCQAGHAYLKLSETQARDFIGIFGEEEVVTGIDAIENGTIDNDAPAYNLAGQKVGKGYKGIVIINGKKVVK